MADIKTIPKETAKAYAAFCAYCELGNKRSLRKLCVDLGRSTTYLHQLASWSGKFHWQDRVKEYERLKHLEYDRAAIKAATRTRQLLLSNDISELRTKAKEIITSTDATETKFTDGVAGLKLVLDIIERVAPAVESFVQKEGESEATDAEIESDIKSVLSDDPQKRREELRRLVRPDDSDT